MANIDKIDPKTGEALPWWKWDISFGKKKKNTDEAEQAADATESDDTQNEEAATETEKTEDVASNGNVADQADASQPAETVRQDVTAAETTADVETKAAPETPAVSESKPAEKPEKKKGFFARLKEGLTKTRDNFVYSLDIVFDGAQAIDDDFYEELEEILIMGDIGVSATEQILEDLKETVEREHIVIPAKCKGALIDAIRSQMAVGEAAYEYETKQSVVFVIGVNGVGKTTTIGKLSSQLKNSGRNVLLAAADTFRAAAGDQLKVWAERAGVPMIGGKEGADPASVLYDAVSAAKARGVDVLIVDTAGRLNNKKNLMEELKKMNRIIDREYPNAHRENLIVLDATTGQNALQQARDFNDVAELSGIVLTKMDGTAKGGIAVAIQSELKVPVKYIGVGEHIEDLQKFDADAFTEALFATSASDEEE